MLVTLVTKGSLSGYLPSDASCFMIKRSYYQRHPERRSTLYTWELEPRLPPADLFVRRRECERVQQNGKRDLCVHQSGFAV